MFVALKIVLNVIVKKFHRFVIPGVWLKIILITEPGMLNAVYIDIIIHALEVFYSPNDKLPVSRAGPMQFDHLFELGVPTCEVRHMLLMYDNLMVVTYVTVTR